MSLHVYRFDCTYDWFVAASPEEAIREWREYHDDPDDDEEHVPEPIQLDDEELFELGDSDGEDIEERSCAEWALLCGPGFLGKEL